MAADPNETSTATPMWFMLTISIPIVVGLLWFGRDFLIPLAVTGLLYIMSSALVDRFKRLVVLGWSPPQWLAQLLSVATVFGAIFLFGLVISSSTDEVQDALPLYQERLKGLADQVEAFVGPKVVTAVSGALAEVDPAAWLGAAASQLVGAISTVALVALYLAFLLSERLAWVEKLPRLARSEEGTKQAEKVLARISTGVKQYMWVNAVTSAMSGTVAFVIFWWIGLDFAPLLALTVFFAGFIPNIGAFIGIALPSLVAFIQFDTFTPFLIVLVGYGFADQFIANVIQPSMQGRSLNLSTFVVMVSLTFWATVWGGIGAFLAIPMMVVAMVVCAEIPAVRWIAVLMSTDGLLDTEDSVRPGPGSAKRAPTGGGLRQRKQAEFEAEVRELRAELENRDT
ncbi:AI-2E family transporter [Ruegeria arenilitoris]|uniref:AI-2E family transporter n=1 Tax=Ruegeria arenilitoris TaxID=1173585 RepID=UPI00147BEE09|nr:AI-2E family transporter [Ruegeria arenilitoris]